MIKHSYKTPIIITLAALMAVFLCAFSPAISPVQSPAGSAVVSDAVVAEEEAAASNYLDGVLDSTVADLDATQSESYSGSGQTWSNLVTSPSDSSSQISNDFYLGADGNADSTDPTFTGSAGDAGAYFALDGGDWLAAKDLSSSTTLKSLGKTTTSFWVAIAFQTPSSLVSSTGIWGGGFQNADEGFTANYTAAGAARLFQFYGSGTTFTTLTPTIGTSTDYLWIVSVDMSATTNNVRSWINTTTKEETSVTWTSNTDNTVNFDVGAGGGSAHLGKAANGTRIYSFALGNEFIDDADAALIFAHLEARHGRDYTP